MSEKLKKREKRVFVKIKNGVFYIYALTWPSWSHYSASEDFYDSDTSLCNHWPCNSSLGTIL